MDKLIANLVNPTGLHYCILKIVIHRDRNCYTQNVI